MRLFMKTEQYTPIQNRKIGALMGAFIGEALGVGPHWYYDLEAQYEAYGKWVDDYTKPKPGRYHDGLEAGMISQQGWLVQLVSEMLVANKGYSEDAFTKMMDERYLPFIDGTPMGGKGGYTSQSMRHLYDKRVREGCEWHEVSSNADTTESLERNIPLAIYYADDLHTMSLSIASNSMLTQSDELIASLSVAYNALLALLIQGESFDESISLKLMKEVNAGRLPFHMVTSKNLSPPKKGEQAPDKKGLFASPDALLTPGYMAQTAADPGIIIEPAWKASIVYGMPCAIYHMLPAVYYLSARFKDDFESGVLHALNGGGQNQVRAMLTGALIGAQVGIEGIPKRFLEGLAESEMLIKLSENLANC